MTVAHPRSSVRRVRGHDALRRQLATSFFFTLLLLSSLIPGRFDLSTDVLGIPVRVLDLLLVILLAMLVFFRVRQGRGSQTTINHVPAVFSGLFAYAALSLVWWSPVTEPDTSAMAWTLLLSAACLWTGYLVVRFQEEELHRFMSSLTSFVAAIAAIYSAQSFLDLGFRSASNAAPDPLFGIDRVRGPLFGASTGGVVLIPAIAFALQEVIAGRSRRRNGLVLAVLLAACFGTGSRAALLGLGVLVAISAFSLRSTRQRRVLGVATLMIGGLAGWLFFSTLSSERLLTLDDAERAMTIQTGANAIAQAGIGENILGLGYGSYWRWYLVDAKGEGSASFTEFVVVRPAGVTLYHPHSTLLLLLVELGIPGLAAGLWLTWAIWRSRKSSVQKNMPTIMFAGLAGSAVTFATDLLIFKAPGQSLIWWTYVLGAMALVDRPPTIERGCGTSHVSAGGQAGIRGCP